jgi:non-ribosomal peptide synthetase component E (peptide arylation enzyme)
MPGVVYPLREDLERYVAAGLYSGETMGQAFTAIARRFPERAALSDGEAVLTFAELDALTDRVAAGLLAAGLNPLDRAVFQIANGIHLVVCLLGCLKASVIPIATLTAHRRAEISYLAKHAQARAHFICSDDPKFDFASFAREMREAVPSLALTVTARGPAVSGDTSFVHLDEIVGNGTEAAVSRLADVEKDPFQVAVFQLSGGTSGIPKIIPRFHNEYLYQIRSVAAWHGLNETTVGFSPAPMMHNAPIICYWGSALWSGGEVVCAPSYDPTTLARLIAARRPNWMSIPLPLLLNLKDAGLLDREIFSKARMSAPNHTRRLHDLTGASVFPLYGMTEGIISYGRRGDPDFVVDRTVGRPISALDEFRIVDPESERPLPIGELGEFCFKGPSSARGYYDAEDRNKEAFTADGFCKSGDLMRIHEIDGVSYVSFEGRVKDVVSRGGEKINCQEVERVLIGHPGIGAIAIVPMPDPVYSERACAFIIPARENPAPNIKDMGAFLENAGLAKFKWPERIELVSEFPMTSSGKVSKPKLREIISDKLKSENGGPLARTG